MDEREFLDKLYQVWSKTTGAEDRYWMPEEYADHSGRWNVFAVGEDDVVGDDGSGRAAAPSNESRKLVASSMRDEDSDFFTAIHGALPDLVRRCQEAYDEADRLDHAADERECRIAELEIEVAELKAASAERTEPWHGKATS